jgi:D-alanyl-D-alanine carboxypeptidase/D-alanyl-D-alanine-endopeptidase (penicillin-binding protein 4)
MDVDVDGRQFDIAVEPVELVEHEIATDDLALMTHHQLEDQRFAQATGNDAIAHVDLSRLSVERDVAGTQHLADHRAGPTGQRMKPRDELVDRERLGHVVVGSGAQPQHAVVEPVARADDQDRKRAARAPQAADQVDAVAVGQAEIENERRIGNRRESILGLRERRNPIRVDRRSLQLLLKDLRISAVVFRDEHSHRAISDTRID